MIIFADIMIAGGIITMLCAIISFFVMEYLNIR